VLNRDFRHDKGKLIEGADLCG